uniref:Uncharacterized protein n=1 Tax=viral metagenome TaxID=1070528 RepID=A0A6C0F8T9_9ZZZZ|tara:strand:- start:19494 stop:19919 length:426 start_codon:yes stop_codon:yes gene_type:complete
MLDHYSDHEMPDLYSRIEDAKQTITKPKNINTKNYHNIIETVCTDTPEFSWTGWIMFGREGDHKNIRQRLINCEENIKNLVDYVYKFIIMKKVYYNWIRIACRPPKHNHPNDKGGALYNYDNNCFKIEHNIIEQIHIMEIK